MADIVRVPPAPVVPIPRTLTLGDTVAVAVNRVDGSLAILRFVICGRSPTLPSGAEWIIEMEGIWYRPPNYDNVTAEVTKAMSLGAEPWSYRIISESEVPTDRSYRDSWIYDGDKVRPDMKKAREIHMDLLRRTRNDELEKLDVEWALAFRRGDSNKITNIEKKAQALRDLPATVKVEKAATVTELKAQWSELLPPIEEARIKKPR